MSSAADTTVSGILILVNTETTTPEAIMNCATCGRPAETPRTAGEGPRREVCADLCHLAHHTDADLSLLERRYWQQYSYLATRARGQNTPSSRKAQAAADDHRPLMDEQRRRRAASVQS